MGAWGTGIFDSDEALDFVGMLIQMEDFAPVEEALMAVMEDEDGYLDAGFAEPGLVAAEVIAALRGHPGKLPGELREWVARIGTASGDMVSLAQQAIARIVGKNSELRELWEDTDEFATWQAVINDLRQRLANSL